MIHCGRPITFTPAPRPAMFWFVTALIFLIGHSGSGGAESEFALIGDTRSSAREYTDYYRSPPGTFQPYTGYRIQIDYRVLSRADDADFFVVVNDLSHPGKTFGWQEWSGAQGAQGSISTTFIQRNKDDDQLVLGIHNRGQIRVTALRIAADPKLKPLILIFPDPARSWTSHESVTYYIDSRHGSDAVGGTSPLAPWKTLARINSARLTPGDKVLLKCGSRWSGYLAPTGSGTAKAPIVVESYGQGPKPSVNANGYWLTTLYLSNSSHIHVSNIDIENRGRQPQPMLTGVEVSENNVGTASDIVLNGLSVHDVTGSELKSESQPHGCAGIDCTCSGDRIPTRFDGLTIENCLLTHTDRNGITMSGAYVRNDWFPSIHVVIKHNVLTDIGGDCIVPVACDGALIEHNIIRGGRMRAPDFAAGIWPWSCDNTVIQYNDVSGMRGIKDGESFDSDWNCRNSLFQYNYSHDNDGGFMLICDDGLTYMPWNIGNIGTTVRYNVSVNDGQFTFYISGPTSRTEIYNNTIYIGQHAARRLVQSGVWGWGWPSGTLFSNNVFYTTHAVDFDFGGMSYVLFIRNAFWGPFVHRPVDPNAILINPRLTAPGSSNPLMYRPTPRSPLVHAGALIDMHPVHDYLDAKVSHKPTIGAFESPT